MGIGINSAHDLKRLLPALLKRAGVTLVVLHFAREISLQLVNYMTSQMQASGREEMRTLITLVGLNFLCEIGWSAVWSFVLISVTRAAVRQEPVITKTSLKDFNQLVVEGIRSMAAVIWRLPFAVIPGLVELLRLLFVPHVVLLDPNYQAGRADALKRSRQVIKRKGGLVLFVALLGLALSNGVELLTQTPGSDAYFWQTPGSFCLQTLVTLAITLVSEVYLIAVFLRVNTALETEEIYDADLQLDAN